MIRKKMIFLIIYLVPLSVISHSNTPDFIYSKGELKVNLSKEEIKEALAEMKKADFDKIPHGMDGGSLVEVEIIKKLPPDKFGQSSWLVKLERIIHPGSIRSKDAEMVLVSPRINEGGVNLKQNRKYRIFAVELEGKFYTRKGLVIDSEL